ncbi:filamentous hemagglutinin N-terminal domain-containing protein [Aerosakkonemataceae cyanobacterium BLCC-F50]|uniref:Filamentous hemagglutinin N-terminal domain-containing protein n=1 Tax=Floridaenema flaviceps BLCC-F50 TaxID=3153642 RepID=A0ABV4XP96_9CYAN
MSINRVWQLGSWKTRVKRVTKAIGLMPLEIVVFSVPALAQIVPDRTLGTENSQITPNVNIRGQRGDRIDGGAARGSNLFHSFSEFNINKGQRVYFANPVGIANIFSRITGRNISNIQGTLGVDGAANLFLLNPNGILFGPNAFIDIQGSFVATTGDRFVFPGGLEFGASNPQAPPLLTMSVPVGVQYGAQPGTITNRANLTVGQDFTLAGGNLDLQGQLRAGRDLTLQAQNTVQVRDSATNPFIASALGNLLVQGNQAVDIVALSHPNSGLFSGGNMVLRSANTVGGDAHYWSGGNFRIEKLDGNLGNLFSPADPVIRASGDVSFDSYEGASLHILAGGSVTITGDVQITGADPDNGLVENVTLSDGKTVVAIDGKNQPTLDIRAGTTAFGSAGITGDTTDFDPVPETGGTGTSANITVGYIRNEGGLVFLTNQYQPNPQLTGNIKATQISTANTTENGNGGNIILDSRDNVEVLGGGSYGQFALGSFADIDYYGGNAGNAGSITIQANGNISIASNFSNNPTALNFGAINASVTTRDPNKTAGNSGNIQLVSIGGDITVNGGIFTNSSSQNGGTSGNSGNITLTARQGTVNVISNKAGAILTRSNTREDAQPSDSTGDAGTIRVDARSIVIRGRSNDDSLDVSTESTRTGQSGNIIFTSQTPLTLTELQIGTDARDGNSGNIKINAPSLTMNNTQVTTTTKGQGRAGDISINATGGQVLLDNGFIFSKVDSTNAVNASGNIRVNAGTIEMRNHARVVADSQSTESEPGLITLVATNQVLIQDSQVTSDSQNNEGAFSGVWIEAKEGSVFLNSTKISAQNTGSAFAGGIYIYARDRIEIKDSTISGSGNFGSISISQSSDEPPTDSILPQTVVISGSNLITTNSAASGVDANEEIFSGFIDIRAIDGISILNSELQAQTNRRGSAGYISLTTGDGQSGHISLNQTTIFNNVEAGGIGNGGKVEIRAGSLSLTNGAQIQTLVRGKTDRQGNIVSSAQGNAGNVNITVSGNVSFDQSSIFSSVEKGGQGNAGSVEIEAGSILLTNEARLNVNNKVQGEAGNLQIQANRVTLNNEAEVSAETAKGNGGNINITTTDLLLRNGSIISTSAGSDQAPGNGGNITIQAKNGFVIAVPSENSDIIANAFEGNGGQISIEANRIFGLQDVTKSNLDTEQVRKRETSDLSASSQFGEQGQVALFSLTIDPSQGLTELPIDRPVYWHAIPSYC